LARQAKSAEVLRFESAANKYGPTKINERERSQAGSFTGLRMKESPLVKSDPAAHAIWLRTVRKYRAIGKDDALFEAALNDYCLIRSELLQLTKHRGKLGELADSLEDLREIQSIMRQIIEIDKQINAKRKSCRDIEDRYAMSVNATMRVVPPRSEKNTEDADDPMVAMLKMRA
jgi:hypothetical protein